MFHSVSLLSQAPLARGSSALPSVLLVYAMNQSYWSQKNIDIQTVKSQNTLSFYMLLAIVLNSVEFLVCNSIFYGDIPGNTSQRGHPWTSQHERPKTSQSGSPWTSQHWAFLDQSRVE